MARHGGDLLISWVVKDAMIPTFSKKLAAIALQVPDQVVASHDDVNANGSFVTRCPTNDRSANSRFASRTS